MNSDTESWKKEVSGSASEATETTWREELKGIFAEDYKGSISPTREIKEGPMLTNMILTLSLVGDLTGKQQHDFLNKMKTKTLVTSLSLAHWSSATSTVILSTSPSPSAYMISPLQMQDKKKKMKIKTSHPPTTTQRTLGKPLKQLHLLRQHYLRSHHQLIR